MHGNKVVESGWNWAGGSGGSGWVEVSEVELKGWNGVE